MRLSHVSAGTNPNLDFNWAMDKKHPIISIITPSYNQSEYLEKTICSVISQGYPELEFIIMDGGSDDGSVEIIKKYLDNIDYWVSEPDKGQADAIYRGFERSSGEIIGWLNSDDFLMPEALKKVALFFEENPHVDCVIGGCLLVDEGGSLIRLNNRPQYYLGLKQDFRKLLFWETGFCQPACFWRRDAFFRVGGFDRDLRFCFDYDMFLRLAKEKPFGVIPDFLACFRHHGESKTSTLSDVCEREKVEVRRKHGLYSTPPIIRYLTRRRYVWEEGFRKRILEIKRKTGRLGIPAVKGGGVTKKKTRLPGGG